MDDDDADEKGTNGNDIHGLKKKRRSVNEKFLEDNSEYYGFQVLTSKLRSSGEAPCCSSSSSSASNSFQNSSSVWEFLHDDKVGKSVTQAFAPSPTPSDCRRTFNSIIIYVLSNASFLFISCRPELFISVVNVRNVIERLSLILPPPIFPPFNLVFLNLILVMDFFSLRNVYVRDKCNCI